MENEELTQGSVAIPDDSDTKDESHVYEQQISGVSSSLDKGDTNGEIDPGIEQPVSINEGKGPGPKEAAVDHDQPSTSGVRSPGDGAPSEPAGESPGPSGGAGAAGGEDDFTEINLAVERDDGHESPQEIRKHQLEELNPAHTAQVFVLKHDIPEYRKVQADSYIWLSMFVLIFFSRIFGAIALYKSIKVRVLFLEKNYDESAQSSRDAKKWNIVGMLFCLFWVVLVIVCIKGLGLLKIASGDGDLVDASLNTGQ